MSLRFAQALRPFLSPSVLLLLQSMTLWTWVSATPGQTGHSSTSEVPNFTALLRVNMAPETTLAMNLLLCPATLTARLSTRKLVWTFIWGCETPTFGRWFHTLFHTCVSYLVSHLCFIPAFLTHVSYPCFIPVLDLVSSYAYHRIVDANNLMEQTWARTKAERERERVCFCGCLLACLLRWLLSLLACLLGVVWWVWWFG